MSILFIGGLALLATLPSVLIANVYLKRRGFDMPLTETVPKFMEVAPALMKAALISLNFTLFGVGLWAIVTYL